MNLTKNICFKLNLETAWKKLHANGKENVTYRWIFYLFNHNCWASYVFLFCQLKIYLISNFLLLGTVWVM